MLAEVTRVHSDLAIGRGLYGARKVWHQLRCEGTDVVRCRVERLMRTAGLQGFRRGKAFVTTMSDPSATQPPDLVRRDFTGARPNQLWVVDFTYLPTWSGMAFTAFVCDVFSRRIVGWLTPSRMPTELPLDALKMALWTRAGAGQSVDGLIHHSDAGTQSTSIRYSERLTDVGAVASIGTVGDSFDNSLAESVKGLYKAECVRHEARSAPSTTSSCGPWPWVHWFNQTRLHSALGHVPPIEFEQAYYRQNSPAQQPLVSRV
jgi:putative transposase